MGSQQQFLRDEEQKRHNCEHDEACGIVIVHDVDCMYACLYIDISMRLNTLTLTVVMMWMRTCMTTVREVTQFS